MLPDTVYLTDPNVSNFPLTYQGAVKDCWTGCYLLPATFRYADNGTCGTFGVAPVAGQVAGVFYRMVCRPGGGAVAPSFHLAVWYKACVPSGATSYDTIATNCTIDPWPTAPHAVSTPASPSVVTAVSPAADCNLSVIFNLQDDTGDPASPSNAFNLYGSSGASNAINVCISTSPTGCPGTLVVPVTGCNGLPLAGAVVKLSNGANATTNSSGNANLVVPPGTYTISSVTATRFNTRTNPPGSYTVAANATTTASAVALTVASGFVCLAGTAKPTKTTLSFTDGNGTHTNGLVWNATTLRWNGCYTKSISGARTSTQCASGTTTSTLAIPIHFSMDQSRNMKVDYSGCASTSPNPGVPTNLTCAGWPWAAANTYTQIVTLTGSLDPLSVNGFFTLPSGATPTVGALLNSSVTVTE